MSDVFDETGTAVPDTEAAPPPYVEYKPLPDPADGEDKREIYDGENADNLRDAAREVTEARARAQAEPLDRGYRYDAGRGEPVESHFTLDAKRAAEELSRVREAEVVGQQPPPAVIAERVDQFRNDSQPQAVQPEQAPTTEAQQPQQPHDPADQVRQVLEQHPAVRQALEQEVASVEAARAQYGQAARQAAQVAAAAVLADHPDLASLPAEQWPHALAAIAKVDPAKAVAIEGKFNRVQALYNQSQQAEAAQRQIQAARFQEYARIEDSRFEKAIANEPTETKRAVIENGARILSSYYGIDAKAFAQAVEGNPALRSAGTQALLYDAIKGRIAEESIASKVARPVPPVQRPGVAGQHSRDSDVEAAMKTFRADPSPKTAANLLIARRAAKGN